VRRLRWTLIALAAVSVFLFLVAPPAPVRVDVAGWDDLAARTIPGAYHVHTTRSDGHGDKAAVAEAAARAGLKFVILTDHGDGTRPPDPPEYIHGVLMIDAVEISTDNGHYVALDLRQTPYPLGGPGYAVLEDVARFGGFGIAAHPDSPKPSLRWTERDGVPDGIEWINADSEWRDETRATLVRAGLMYFLRPAPALATLLDRPVTLDRWDGLLRHHRVVALAASDAHGGVGRRVEDPNRTLFSAIGIPSYEASFRELSVRVVLDRRLYADAGLDERLVTRAVRHGDVFTVIDALASPALLDVHAVPSGATVTLLAKATVPHGGQLLLIGPAGELASAAQEIRREVPAATPGAYRVEVRLPGAPGQPPVPWLVSNAIQVGPLQGSAPISESGTSTRMDVLPSDAPPFPWRIEKDAASTATLRTGPHSAELDYRLAEGVRNSQFVALATDVAGQAFRAFNLDLSADRPARVTVQVRTADGRRWGRSFSVEAGQESQLHGALRDMRPVGDPGGAPPAPGSITSFLIVVDLTNASPGQSGTLRVLSSDLVK
jgi:hypothetical protein